MILHSEMKPGASGENPIRVAMLGMGAMHRRIARNLLDAGFNLAIYNRTAGACVEIEALGAEVFDTPRAAATGADYVLSMVTNDDAAHAVWLGAEDGAIHALDANTIAIECSTLSVEACRLLAGHIAQTGAAFVDAPVVGSLPQAEAGQLIYLVGGSADLLARVKPVLAVNAREIISVGSQTDGMKLKLVTNTLFAQQLAAVSELIAVLAQSGMALDQIAPVLASLPVASPAMLAGVALIQRSNFAPLFPLQLATKDICYMAQFAQAAGVDAPMTAQTQALYLRARDKGLGEENITSIYKLFMQEEIRIKQS